MGQSKPSSLPRCGPLLNTDLRLCVYAPKPFVEITEQPHPNAVRFRYLCKGKSTGSIPGVNTTADKKTFPTIRVHGYRGQTMVVVSCVTKDGPPYKPHPNNLYGKNCEKGVCRVLLNSESMSYSFENLGIQWEDIAESLAQRNSYGDDPFGTGFAHASDPTSIDMDAVRLCFRVFFDSDETGCFKKSLPPVVSDVIYDKKPKIVKRMARKPYAKITEQPHPELKYEGQSTGSITGVNTTADKKTFPTIRIYGCPGEVDVVVSCVTNDGPAHKPHPHRLVGTDCYNGVCTLRITAKTKVSYSFEKLCIQCVKMEQVGESLLERYNKSVDPFATGFLHANNPGLIDLNACRLCFQVFLQDETTRRFTEPLKPIVSDVIYVKKGMPELIDGPLSDLSDSEPFVEITEQPHPRTLRLRYEDEGRLIAPILGVNTTANNKTFPTIPLKTRYLGRVKVIVSCVTADGPAHKPHPCSLIGEDCKHGVCMIEMNSETMSYSFNNLRLHCVKVDEVAEALRHREELLVDPFRTGFGHTNQPGSISMDAFRLCFEVYLEGKKSGHYKKPLAPVMSDVIYYKNR